VPGIRVDSVIHTPVDAGTALRGGAIHRHGVDPRGPGRQVSDRLTANLNPDTAGIVPVARNAPGWHHEDRAFLEPPGADLLQGVLVPNLSHDIDGERLVVSRLELANERRGVDRKWRRGG
jgi:hypothetical protein